MSRDVHILNIANHPLMTIDFLDFAEESVEIQQEITLAAHYDNTRKEIVDTEFIQ